MESKFKVSEIISAMEKNGFPFATGTVYDENSGASCIFGQAARNLFPKITDPQTIIANGWALISAVNECDAAGSDIWKYNDDHMAIQEGNDYAEILEYAKLRLRGFEETEVTMFPDLEEI